MLATPQLTAGGLPPLPFINGQIVFTVMAKAVSPSIQKVTVTV
jgi:hypothetical protein